MARNCEELVVSSDVLSLLKTSIPKEAAFLSAPSASGTLCAGASNATDGEAKGSHSSPIEGNCQVTMDCSILRFAIRPLNNNIIYDYQIYILCKLALCQKFDLM